MAIFELTGVPCSGKSHFIDSLQKNDSLGTNILLFEEQLVLSHYNLNFFKGKFGQFIAEFLLLSSLITYNRGYIRVIYELIILSNKIELGFSKRCNLYRNILLKFSRLGFAIHKLGRQSIIFDEGISHIPFNFISEDLGITVKSCEVFELYQEALSGVNVIVLDTTNVDLFTRLKKRGHKRTSGKSDEFIKQFSLRNEAVYLSSMSCLDKFCHQVNLINPNNDWTFKQ